MDTLEHKTRLVEVIETGRVLFGEQWRASLATALGFSDSYQIEQWLTCDRAIPDTIYADLSGLLVAQRECIDKRIAAIQERLSESHQQVSMNIAGKS